MTGTDRAPEPNEQLQQGMRLHGNLVRFHHWAPGTGILCTKVHPNGMVELHGMAGCFAPSLFEIDGDVTAVPLIGEVN